MASSLVTVDSDGSNGRSEDTYKDGGRKRKKKMRVAVVFFLSQSKRARILIIIIVITITSRETLVAFY